LKTVKALAEAVVIQFFWCFGVRFDDHDQRFEHTLQLSELVFNLGSPLGSLQKDRTEAISGTYFRLFPNLKDSPCCELEPRVCVRGAVHDGQQVIALVAGTIASWSSVASDVLRL